MAEYIGRDDALKIMRDTWMLRQGDDAMQESIDLICKLPAADVRHVIVCAKCRHNNHCFTQAFIDDCGKIPLDRNTFFCADGEEGE